MNASTQCNYYVSTCVLNEKKTKNCGNQTIKPRTKQVSVQVWPMVQSLLPNASVNDFQIKCSQTKEIATQTLRNITKTSEKACSTTSNDKHGQGFVNWLQYDILSQTVHECHKLELDYRFAVNNGGEGTVIVSNPRNFGLVEFNLDLIQAVITSKGKCSLFILFKPVEIFSLVTGDGGIEENKLQNTLTKIKGHDFIFCPGIDFDGSYTKPSVEIFTTPFPRCQAKSCLVWYERNPLCRKVKVSRCDGCIRLVKTIKMFHKRKQEETPTIKAKRVKVANVVSVTASPNQNSVKQLKSKKIVNKTLDDRIYKMETQLEQRSILLNNTQSDELSSVVTLINSDYNEDLVQLLNETGNNTEVLEHVWKKDSKLAEKKRALAKDPNTGNVTGRTGNKWSSITLRIALAVFHCSPSAYEQLKSYKILNLPSEMPLTRQSKNLFDEPGICYEYLNEQQTKYDEFKKERSNEGKLLPMGDGALIFDEMKVVEKVIWNSKEHKFLGLSMDPDEISNLQDVFENPTEPQPTQYVLQFLWRDLTSSFDMIGPYYTFSTSPNADDLEYCVLKTTQALIAHDFGVFCVVCTGGSSNLVAVKKLMEFTGIFECTPSDSASNFQIFPQFENPFKPGRNIYLMMCPTNELKSLLSSLHSSRQSAGGTKSFSRNEVYFGWEEIENMKKRDDERAENGQIRKVPMLHESYVIRDACARLYIESSKIMQQENVLSELYSFACNDGVEPFKIQTSTLQCYNFLRACNKIFENGFLSSEQIKNLDDKVLSAIRQGYIYFVEWLNEIYNKDCEFNLISPKQTDFITWQTWDSLRIAIFGFELLAKDFFERYPGYFITPDRINASAIESVCFSTEEAN